MTTIESLSQETIDHYRREGFVRVSGIITPDEAAEFLTAAHVVTDPLNLTIGDGIEGELFPEV